MVGNFGHRFLSAGLTQAMGNVKGVFTNAPQVTARIGNAFKAAVSVALIYPDSQDLKVMTLLLAWFFLEVKRIIRLFRHGA